MELEQWMLWTSMPMPVGAGNWTPVVHVLLAFKYQLTDPPLLPVSRLAINVQVKNMYRKKSTCKGRAGQLSLAHAPQTVSLMSLASSALCQSMADTWHTVSVKCICKRTPKHGCNFNSLKQLEVSNRFYLETPSHRPNNHSSDRCCSGLQCFLLWTF